MKYLSRLIAIFVIFSSLVTLRAQDLDTVSFIEAEPFYTQETMLVAQILERYHFRKASINDSLSSVIFDNYLESLDHNKLYLLKSDVDQFEKYRYKFDEILNSGNLEIPYKMYHVLKVRFLERSAHIDRLLERKFDFTINEFFNSDRSEALWAETSEELDEIWRKVIKSQALNLKLAGKELGEALAILNKRYARYQKIFVQNNSEDIFQQFMNTVAETFDPHTNYFSPVNSETFLMTQTLSLEGIGAQLTTEGDYTIIASIVPGGPAFKGKELKEKDKIVGVAQGDEGEFVDVVGWRVTDVVKLIRGPKGTVVRLQIIEGSESVNSPPKIVRIVREKIKLEDEKVTSEVIPITREGKEVKLGIITVPSFYFDYEGYRKGDKDYASTSKDVRRILNEFKKQNVTGIMVDLRRNGGGSLQEAIELSGLFIKKGPVVQVKDINGSIDVQKDPDPEEVWTGPMAVLIDKFSASASEIFAGAIQDYGRGVIIGDQSYGKGTVQSMYDLDRFLPDIDEKLGQLKMTIAKFYRVTGSSTQHKGVHPDIQLPSAYSAEIYGESSRKSALPWDQIRQTDYSESRKVSEADLQRLVAIYEKRLKTDQTLKNLLADIQETRENQANNLQSLEEATRKREMEEAEKRRAARNKLTGTINPEAKDIEFSDIKEDDPYLKEGILILVELVTASIG